MASLKDFLFHEEPGITLYCGDARTILPLLESASIQTCVTSPPYWGLRDYGHAAQLGLEPTPGKYVEVMREVFTGVRTALREDGTLWLNLGDSYNGYMANQRATSISANNQHARPVFESGRGRRTDALKAKDLIGIPWRVAFALQADGWYLRSDIIWAKPNPMPESVEDRPTKAHEYIFLMARGERYYYDADAIKEPVAEITLRDRVDGDRFRPDRGYPGSASSGNGRLGESTMRNKRSVWTVAPAPFHDAHFATFPADLIKPCVLAGAPVGGIVLDPFSGAGTTLYVAKELGRQCVGIEIEPRYCEIAVKRLRQEVLPFAKEFA